MASRAAIHIFADLEELSQAAASRFVELAAAHQPFNVALSGGNTPRKLYEILETRSDIDWRTIHLFMGDERYVPPTDERSNDRMIRSALVSHIPIPANHYHPVYLEDGWNESANAYDRLLRQSFPGPGYTFDLAIQGMGDDGHTASVFPGRDPAPAELMAVAVTGPEPAPQRISCTIECLARSRVVMFLVSGSSKASRLREVLTDPSAPDRLPAARLSAAAEHTEWLVDADAAAML